MAAPSPLTTPEPWNLVASGYVAENLPAFEAFATEALHLVPARGEVVDVAAGPGSLTLLAARTAQQVHAVDFAPAMLKELEARAAAAGVTNVRVHQADGQALPFPDGRFDASYSMFGLIFFPDHARGLAEMARVLRPGAGAVVSSWPPPERIPAFAALFGAMKAELPGMRDRPTVLGTATEITAEMRQAGFREVHVREHEFVGREVNPVELWRSFARGGASAVLVRKQMGVDEFERLSKRIVSRLEQALGTGRRELRMTALLGVGTR